MIDAKELRVGNKVYRDGAIVTILPLNIVEQYQCTLVGRKCFKPIPLTEEILLEYGFERQTSKTLYDWLYIGLPNFLTLNICQSLGVFNKIEIARDFRETECFVDFEFVATIMEPDNENGIAVHQLQNLYHALRGEELEVKL